MRRHQENSNLSKLAALILVVWSLAAACTTATSPAVGKTADSPDQDGSVEVSQDDVAIGITDSLVEESVVEDSSGEETSDDGLCGMACAVLAEVPCSDRMIDCVSVCERQIARDVCAADLRALDTCIVAAGSGGLSCLEPIGTVRKSGVCQVEGDAYRACRSGGDAG